MILYKYEGTCWLDMGNYIQQVGGDTRNDENFSDMLNRHIKKYSGAWKELAKL